MSDDIDQVAAALAAANADIDAVGKAGRANLGTGGTFAYRGIDAVVNALHPVLARHGLVLIPRDLDTTLDERGMVTLTTRWVWLHQSGQSIAATIVAAAHVSQGRGYGVARSYSLRELLSRTFTLPTDDDLEQQPGPALDPLVARRGEVADAFKSLTAAQRQVAQDTRKASGWPTTQHMTAEQLASMLEVLHQIASAPSLTGDGSEPDTEPAEAASSAVESGADADPVDPGGVGHEGSGR
jgi:hypothetical protein